VLNSLHDAIQDTVLKGEAAPALLRVSAANPHYLEYRGKPILLISSAEHYGAVINQDFDFSVGDHIQLVAGGVLLEHGLPELVGFVLADGCHGLDLGRTELIEDVGLAQNTSVCH